MKAILVKDNDFKTIGFEVTTNGQRVFNYGISPQTTNFTKEINCNDWMIQIIDLIKIEATIREQSDFMHNFFSVAMKANLVNKVKNSESKGGLTANFLTTNFDENEEAIEANKRKMKNIIDNIL